MQTEVRLIASPVNRKSHVGKVSTDIGETQDLAAAMPEKVKELQSKWDVWNIANIKPRWGSAHTDNDGAEPGSRRPPKKAKKAADRE